MKWMRLYESFKDYREELDKLHKELEEKRKEYLSKIESELSECMYDITDNWKYEYQTIHETKEITVYYRFELPISQFKKFTNDLKSSTDIIVSKLQPTKIKIGEIELDNDRILPFNYYDYDLISSSSIPAKERISNWSNYYSDFIDCLFGEKDVSDITDTRWSDFIKSKIKQLMYLGITPDDKIEVHLRIII